MFKGGIISQGAEATTKPQMETPRYIHTHTHLNTHVNTDLCTAGHADINTLISMA